MEPKKSIDTNHHIENQVEEKEVEKQECEFCGKIYSTAGNVTKHISLVHGKLWTIKCQLCEEMVSSEKVLKLHIALWTKPWRNYFEFFEIMVSNDSLDPETLYQHV